MNLAFKPGNNPELDLVSIDSGTDLHSELGRELLKLCESARKDSTLTAKNISDENWQVRPESLLYCIYVEKRFDAPSGRLFAAILNGEMIAIGGAYRADFNPDQFAIAGTRTFTKPEHRNKFWHGEYLIPAQIQWAVDNKICSVLFSFNKESLKLMDFLKRASKNRAGVLGKSFPDVYKNLSEHPKAVKIKNTTQRIFKLNLVSDFEWDFSQIETDEPE